MPLLRSLLLSFALLAQVLPASTVARAGATGGCTMECCASLVQQQALDACQCSTTPGSPAAPIPATLPPAPGRDLVPVANWVAEPFLILISPSEVSLPHGGAQRDTVEHLSPPHVRLPVLFCSILI